MKKELAITLAFIMVVGLALKRESAARVEFDTMQSRNMLALVDMKSGYLLGGSVRKNKTPVFVTATEMVKSLRERTPYAIYSATKRLGQGVGTKPKAQGAPCEETLFVNLSPNKGTQSEFAIAGTWNALPRVPKMESTSQKVYRNAVAAILKKRGIAKPNVKITQVWRVDLDGDKREEVLISATSKDRPGNDISSGASAGQYSILALRKLVRGKVQTIPIDGEIYPKAKEFNAPSFYRIAAVLDVDGDSKMEILTRGRYYEGDWTTVYSVRGEKVSEVLAAGCGA